MKLYMEKKESNKKTNEN